MTPQPEKRRLRVSSGSHSPAQIADRIAPYRPFVQQIDIVFPSNPTLLEDLKNLKTSYSKGKVKLSDVIDDEAFVNNNSVQSELLPPLLVSHCGQVEEEDIWCIEPHPENANANLALCVSKDTYERLGLVGYKLPSSTNRQHRSGERYVIGIPLGKNAQSPKILGKVRAALARWDEMREPVWDVVYCSRSPSISIKDAQICDVECKTREMCDVHIPAMISESSLLTASNRRQRLDYSVDDDGNHQQIQTLFEWVGMSCLGAQRLFANDRVDPFVAVYEPPAPSYIGNIACLQWKGLLHPEFVKRVLDVVTANLRLASSAAGPSFVAITVHGFTNSPISYHQQRRAAGDDLFSSSHLPLKAPKKGGEDTWVLLISRTESDDSMESAQTEEELKWCLMESLG